MKVKIEVSFIIESEPSIFSDTDKAVRTVYLWLNKRGQLDSDNSWIISKRLSITEQICNDETQKGFVEVWGIDTDNMTNPPNDIDDIWKEEFKFIEMKNYRIEWHPNQTLLRISWIQNSESLQEHKIVSPVLLQLEKMGLDFPNFPKLLF